jgi:hypothetical protein
MSWPLHPQGKSPRFPLDRRLGGHQSRSGSGVEEENSQPLPELEPQTIQNVAQRYTTELSRLLSEKSTVKYLQLFHYNRNEYNLRVWLQLYTAGKQM